MKVVKKTRLLSMPKKRVTVTLAEGGANTELGKTWINIEGENFDGVRGYEVGEGDDCSFAGKVTLEDETSMDVTFEGTTAGALAIATLDILLDVGTKFTVELEPDPAKTDFDPTPAVLEGVVLKA